MARFCTLCSGSNGNSAYVGSSDSGVLVDAGMSCKQLLLSMEARSINPRSIQGILITHEHSDHISGLRVLLKKIPVPVYASQAVLERLWWTGVMPREHPAVAVEKAQPFEVGALAVRCFDTPHDSAHSLGFRFEMPDGSRIAVATDLGYVTDEVRAQLCGCDLVLIESNYDASMLSVSAYPYHLKRRIASNEGHLSNEACTQELCRLVRSGSTRFVLGHLSKENNLPALAEQTARCGLLEGGLRERMDFQLLVAPRGAPSEMVTL